MDRREQRKHADAIRDEVGRVLRSYDALAERRGQERLEVVEQPRLCARRGNQLDQVHVARRIEKVHAAESASDFRRERFSEPVDRQSRSIAREYRVLAEMRRDFTVRSAFQSGAPKSPRSESHSLRSAGADRNSRLNLAGPRRQRERARLELEQTLDRLARVAVRVAFLPRSSYSSAETFALTRCAAICAPMTPAPSTAALRTMKRVEADMSVCDASER